MSTKMVFKNFLMYPLLFCFFFLLFHSLLISYDPSINTAAVFQPTGSEVV